MRGYLIDVENGKHGPVEVKDDNHLEQFYRLIGCRCIDIAVRKVGETYYNVVLDDEGLLVEDPITSAIDHQHHGMLAGNLVIFGMDEQTMDLAPLTDDDVRNIRKNLMVAIDTEREMMYAVAVMDY